MKNNKEKYKFRSKEPKEALKRIKFDVMIGERFIKRFTLEYNGESPSEERMCRLAESKLPTVLKDKNYEIYYNLEEN